MKLEEQQDDRYCSTTGADPCNNLLFLQRVEYDEESRLSNNSFNNYNRTKLITNRTKINEPTYVQKERLKKNAERARKNRSRETEEKANIRRMKNALRAAFRRENETPEEREERRRQNMMRARIRRQAESEDDKIVRRSDAAARASFRRQKETEEQASIRRMKNALRAAMRRRNESPEEREERRRKNKIRARIRRRAESNIETNVRRYNDAVRTALKRNGESESETKSRRLRDNLRAADRRKEETLDQRELRLGRDRERVRKNRTLKKMFEQIHRLSEANELPVLTIPVKTEQFEGDPRLNTSSLVSLFGECSRANMETVQENSQKLKERPTIQFPPEISLKVESIDNGMPENCGNYWGSSALGYTKEHDITPNIFANGIEYPRNPHLSNIAEDHSVINTPALRNFLQL